jgi:DNA-binding NarL/FixJ family response regulator
VEARQAQASVTVVLVRFEDLVARGLRSLLDEEATIDVVAADLEPEALPDALAELRPMVALLNYGSLRTPFEVQELCDAFPATQLLVLASRPTPAEAAQMVAFGAAACLSKETQARDVLTAIHLASRGLQVLPPRRPDTSGPAVLTPRESDVLVHLRAGRANAQIAAELHVSIETVRSHARSIYRKLGVRTRRELQGLGR